MVTSHVSRKVHAYDNFGGKNAWMGEDRTKRVPMNDAPPLGEPLAGYIFVCNEETMDEDLRLSLFGLPLRYLDSVRDIRPGMPLFLYNYSTRRLHGIYEATSGGGLNLDPDAWENKEFVRNGAVVSKYPTQVRVKVREERPALDEVVFRKVLYHYDGSKFRLALGKEEVDELFTLFGVPGGNANGRPEAGVKDNDADNDGEWERVTFKGKTKGSYATRPGGGLVWKQPLQTAKKGLYAQEERRRGHYHSNGQMGSFSTMSSSHEHGVESGGVRAGRGRDVSGRWTMDDSHPSVSSGSQPSSSAASGISGTPPVQGRGRQGNGSSQKRAAAELDIGDGKGGQVKLSPNGVGDIADLSSEQSSESAASPKAPSSNGSKSINRAGPISYSAMLKAGLQNGGSDVLGGGTKAKAAVEDRGINGVAHESSGCQGQLTSNVRPGKLDKGEVVDALSGPSVEARSETGSMSGSFASRSSSVAGDDTTKALEALPQRVLENGGAVLIEGGGTSSARQAEKPLGAWGKRLPGVASSAWNRSGNNGHPALPNGVHTASESRQGNGKVLDETDAGKESRGSEIEAGILAPHKDENGVRKAIGSPSNASLYGMDARSSRTQFSPGTAPPGRAADGGRGTAVASEVSEGGGVGGDPPSANTENVNGQTHSMEIKKENDVRAVVAPVKRAWQGNEAALLRRLADPDPPQASQAPPKEVAQGSGNLVENNSSKQEPSRVRTVQMKATLSNLPPKQQVQPQEAETGSEGEAKKPGQGGLEVGLAGGVETGSTGARAGVVALEASLSGRGLDVAQQQQQLQQHVLTPSWQGSSRSAPHQQVARVADVAQYQRRPQDMVGHGRGGPVVGGAVQPIGAGLGQPRPLPTERLQGLSNQSRRLQAAPPRAEPQQVPLPLLPPPMQSGQAMMTPMRMNTPASPHTPSFGQQHVGFMPAPGMPSLQHRHMVRGGRGGGRGMGVDPSTIVYMRPDAPLAVPNTAIGHWGMKSPVFLQPLRAPFGGNPNFLPPPAKLLASMDLSAVHEEILELAMHARPSFAARASAEAAVECVRKSLQALWPGSDVEIFGSFATGLCLPHSDVDCVVVGAPSAPISAEHAVPGRAVLGPLIRELAVRLEKEDWCESLSSIETASMPVVKLRCRPPVADGDAVADTRQVVAIDITIGGRRVNQEVPSPDAGAQASTLPPEWRARVEAAKRMHNGAAAREFVIDRMRKLPALAPLVLLMKSYLHHRGLKDVYSGGLGSFSLTLMLVFYLERVAPEAGGPPPATASPSNGTAAEKWVPTSKAKGGAMPGETANPQLPALDGQDVPKPSSDATPDTSEASLQSGVQKSQEPTSASASAEKPHKPLAPSSAATSSAGAEPPSMSSSGTAAGAATSALTAAAACLKTTVEMNDDADDAPMKDGPESGSRLTEVASAGSAGLSSQGALLSQAADVDKGDQPQPRPSSLSPDKLSGAPGGTEREEAVANNSLGAVDEIVDAMRSVPSPQLAVHLAGFLHLFGEMLDLSTVKLVLKGNEGEGGVFLQDKRARRVVLWIDDPLRPGHNIGGGSFAMFNVQQAMREMLAALCKSGERQGSHGMAEGEAISAEETMKERRRLPVLDELFKYLPSTKQTVQLQQQIEVKKDT